MDFPDSWKTDQIHGKILNSQKRLNSQKKDILRLGKEVDLLPPGQLLLIN